MKVNEHWQRLLSGKCWGRRQNQLSRAASGGKEHTASLQYSFKKNLFRIGRGEIEWGRLKVRDRIERKFVVCSFVFRGKRLGLFIV